MSWLQPPPPGPEGPSGPPSPQTGAPSGPPPPSPSGPSARPASPPPASSPGPPSGPPAPKGPPAPAQRHGSHEWVEPYSEPEEHWSKPLKDAWTGPRVTTPVEPVQQHYDPHYVPAQAVANPTHRPTVRRWVIGGLVTLAFTVVALMFAVFFGLSFGIVATLVGLLFALIPLVLVIPPFLWLDRVEPEPWRYLLTAFFWGALFATLMAIVINSTAGLLATESLGAESADVFTAVVVAPLTEETGKGLFLLVMLLFRRKEFNGLADGIVYAGICAAGFAFLENILYLARALTETGGVGLAVTFFLRGIMSPFCHPMFTAMTGIGVGLAATTRSTPVKILAPFVGWCAAVLLHGLWNLGASFGLIGLGLNLTIGGLLFLSFLYFIYWTRQREGRIIGQFLEPYAAAGWLSPGEVSMLSSMRHRREARAWAKLNGGPTSLGAMRAFQDSASELALLRARMYNHRVDHDELHNERILLDSMTARRREFAGMSMI